MVFYIFWIFQRLQNSNVPFFRDMTRTEICLSEQLETSASASEIIQGDKTYQNLSQDGFVFMMAF